jgi:hypothetical protein
MGEILKLGQHGTFLASCGQAVTGIVKEVTDDGYIVQSDGEPSNWHEDGLYRFTFS